MAKKTVYIELTSAIAMQGEICRAGSVVECDDALAKDLMHRGRGKLSVASTDDNGDSEAVPLSEHSVSDLKEIAAEYEIDGAAT